MAILNMHSGGGGVRIALEPPTNVLGVGQNESILLKWDDPVDKVATPGGETVAQWSHTTVVRKQGSAPTNPLDGVQVVKETVRNQYSTNGFTDTGLVNGEEYFYTVFAFTTLGLFSSASSTGITTKQEVFYVGILTGSPLTSPVYDPASASIGEYGLIAGGTIDRTETKTGLVNAYNSSLTKVASVTSLSITGGGIAATSTPSYAFFAGNTGGVCWYDSSLVRGTGSIGVNAISSGSCSIGDYAIFTRGSNSSSRFFAYNSSLTKQELSREEDSAYYCAGTQNDPYGLLIAPTGEQVGRPSDYRYYGKVAAFNASLTRTAPSVRPQYMVGFSMYVSAFRAGTTALFPAYSWTGHIDAYDASLTYKDVSSGISGASANYTGNERFQGKTVGDWGILFNQGKVSTDIGVAFVFDPFLTRSDRRDDYEGTEYEGYALTSGAATVAGTYVLYGGGDHVNNIADDITTRVIAYQLR